MNNKHTPAGRERPGRCLTNSSCTSAELNSATSEMCIMRLGRDQKESTGGFILELCVHHKVDINNAC
jgi:hypothetical protein